MLRARRRAQHHANDLAGLLAKVTPPNRPGGWLDPRHPVPRVDVVSESLCDDVISYLSPTLEQHKGCTLIDLQPGACLFSSKLHDYLKPKCHLLIEPEDHYYTPFIKPLLDQPGSTYRYTQLNIQHQSSYWVEFDRILRDPTLLPARPAFPPEDPALRQLDPSTLIVGNLARQPKVKSLSNTVDQAPLMIHSMSYHALANQAFQTNGLVRMLFWVPEVFKPGVFSVLPWLRSSFNIGLDMAVSVSEVAAVQSLESLYQSRAKVYKRRSRSILFENISQEEVAESMHKAGMVVPPTRKLAVPPSASLAETTDRIQPISPYRIRSLTPSTLQDEVSELRASMGKFATLAHNRSRPKSSSLIGDHKYPQVEFVVKEYGKATDPNLTWWATKALLDIALQMINVEVNFKAVEETAADPTAIDQLREDVHRLDAEYTELFASVSRRTRIGVTELLEDQMAFFLSPRLLNVHERSYEALKADSSEFWPKQDLTLLDLVPKARDLSVPDLANREECTNFCGELLKMLLGHRTLSLPQALDKIGINAAKDLIPMVPAITDPRRGGRLNPNNLRVRMITEEMVAGLVKAFFEWPFRPASWQLALSEDITENQEEAEQIEKAEK